MELHGTYSLICQEGAIPPAIAAARVQQASCADVSFVKALPKQEPYLEVLGKLRVRQSQWQVQRGLGRPQKDRSVCACAW